MSVKDKPCIWCALVVTLALVVCVCGLAYSIYGLIRSLM